MSRLVEQVAELVKNENDTSEIERAARWLWDEYKRRKEAEDARVALSFNEGDLVVFEGKDSRKLPHGAVGRIERVNSKSINVDFGVYGPWRVHATSLKPAPKGAKMTKGKPLFGYVPVRGPEEGHED